MNIGYCVSIQMSRFVPRGQEGNIDLLIFAKSLYARFTSKLTRLDLRRRKIVALGDSSGVPANIFEPQLVIANIYQRIPFSRDEILFRRSQPRGAVVTCRFEAQL